MPDPAAPAQPAAPAPDAFDSAVARIEARKDEAAAAEGKAPATPAAGASTASSTNAAAATGGNPRPRAADIGALAQREWAARQKEQAAAALQARYKPLDGALGKKDLRGALEVMAKEHGVTFADFVSALTEAEPPQKTPQQIAEETVAAKLAERDAEADKQRQAHEATELQAREAATRANLQAQAEAGAEGAPNRWELTAIAGKGGEAWDVIWGHFQATCKYDAQGKFLAEGERLTREQALDLIEAKLVEKRDARRPKQETATGSGAGNGRNEAAGTATQNGGRAAAPSFTNRATSGMPAVVGAHAVDEAGLPEHEAISRIAGRLGIRL